MKFFESTAIKGRKENTVKPKTSEVILDTENNQLQRCVPPLYFLDINTYRVAVPDFNGHWPYRHIPFLFSLQKKATIDAEPSPYYFVAEVNTDPCEQFAENLVNTIVDEGAIIVFERKFVVARLKELQKEYLHLAMALEKIISRIIELNISQKEDYLKMQEKNAAVPPYSAEDVAALWYNLRFEKYGLSTENDMQLIKQYHQNRALDLLNMAISKSG